METGAPFFGDERRLGVASRSWLPNMPLMDDGAVFHERPRPFFFPILWYCLLQPCMGHKSHRLLFVFKPLIWYSFSIWYNFSICSYKKRKMPKSYMTWQCSYPNFQKKYMFIHARMHTLHAHAQLTHTPHVQTNLQLHSDQQTASNLRSRDDSVGDGSVAHHTSLTPHMYKQTYNHT